ncbi:hypothetical protein NDS46_30440 (plasmid) [Paenibacillus thiaminolyticus]|uniref:hypothetical protein n=1 Tax=Paenibacillus thiaminolyticus TaxID=49283 RepID=UPI00232D74F7|nr:hypothetical protein [Paenibacillus thiaminolyticus]WCF11668.1 hypothetical protein NDS46_30440 [Paenibacillus thiaminolyticus]
MEVHKNMIEKMKEQSKLLLEGRNEEARKLNAEIQELSRKMDEAIVRSMTKQSFGE